MKTIIKYIKFLAYMLKSFRKRREYEDIIKGQGEEAGEKYLDDSVMDWVNYLIKILEINLIVSGKENIPKENYLIVSNHQGNLDIPCIMGAIDKRIGFIAKKEMENTPLMSYWMKKINCIFIDRENIREAVKSINEGVEILKSGKTMAIFPEGTRSKGKEIGEFKKGSLKLGIKAGVPILPISISGSYKIMEESNGLIIRKGDVLIKIGEPIYTDKLTPQEIKDLPGIVENIIRKNFNEL